jgi:hypothetical protein
VPLLRERVQQCRGCGQRQQVYLRGSAFRLEELGELAGG